MPITLFENPGYTGRSLTIDLGTRRFFTPEDFNDVAASIQVPAGLVVILYEHADDAGGFGVVVDLMEDCPDLGVYGMAKRVSYVNVIASPNVQGFVWARAVEENGQFIAGHWERQRANGQLPPNLGHAAIWPAIPSQLPPAPTALWVNGPTTVITTLGPQDFAGSSYWNHAVNDQMGVLGSDYRNAEEIGTAAFERASNNPVLPDWINFWYPQMPARDHRAPHKRTLVGSLRDVHIAEISGTFQDHDVNIDVTPDPLYQYLLSDAHPREYTDIMKAEYYGTAGQKGQPDCDDAASKAEFTFVEGEVQPSSNVHSGVAEKLRDGIANGDGKVALYGPWIYDKGHCCHSEIHPAEQIWWRTGSTATTYHLNVFCDASKRFWWRDQMDDGTKLKPWGAPPIVGVFAIAFEVDQPSPVARSHALEFTVSQVSATNVASLSPGGPVSELTYEGATLVRFRPNSDAFTVAFEQVGTADNGRIRGFLVLQTTVGTLTQKVVNAQFPAGTDVNAIDQDDERDVFDKQEGHHMFTVTQRYEGDVVIAKKVPKKKKAKKTAGRKKATVKSAKATTKKVAKKAASRSG